MSKLSVYLSQRTKNKDHGAEYEEAFRTGKIFNNTMNKAILGKASKNEIEHSIILMQASLEIVKSCNGSSSSDVMLGVNTLFDTVEAIEEDNTDISVEEAVEEEKPTTKQPSKRRR